jgi:hypothetical protein
MATCQRCNGRGEIVTCIDDMCANNDECLHGDGYDTCPCCEGEGQVYDDEDFNEDDFLNEEPRPPP